MSTTNNLTHPSYYCDGGCGKKVGEGNDDECQRICDDCWDDEDEEVEAKAWCYEHSTPGTIDGDLCDCPQPCALPKFDDDEGDLCCCGEKLSTCPGKTALCDYYEDVDDEYPADHPSWTHKWCDGCKSHNTKGQWVGCEDCDK